MHSTLRSSTRVAAIVAALLLALLALPTRGGAENAAFHHSTPALSQVVARRGVAFTQSNGAPVLMDVYRPAKPARGSRLPVLVLCNTLAMRSLRGDSLTIGWAMAATAQGILVIVADAASDFAAGFDALLGHLRTHAAEMGADPDRIAVFAASGNVSGVLPVIEDPRRTAVKAAVVYYGFAAIPVFRPDLPVLFVRAGLDRPGVNEMVDSLIASALRANAPIQVINDPAGHHALEMHDDTDVTRAVIDQTLHFVIDATDPRLQASLRTGIPEVHAAGAMINGDYATAVALYADLVAVRPDDATLRLAYGEALLGAGRAHDARAQFDRLKDAGLGKRDLGLPAAAAAMVDGDADAAIAWLKTIPMRFLPGDLATDPTFASLHGRADFQALFK